MTETLQIRMLRDWRYAGKPVDEAVVHSERYEGSHRIVSLPSSYLEGETYAMREYNVEKGYLIPHYPQTGETRRRRDTQLLKDRVQRFFYSCEPRLDVTCSKEYLDAELASFDRKLAAINAQRADAGKPPFSLSMSYRAMTEEERSLLSDGAQIVGHAVNRLGSIGVALLQGSREGVKIEYSDEYIKNHRDKIVSEVASLWARIIDDSNLNLVRCVLTRDGNVDHDGVFHHLIREMIKPVQSILMQDHSPRTKAEQQQDTPIIQETRTNIVSQIGYCLEAIDEVALNLQNISMNPAFGRLVNHNRLLQPKSLIAMAEARRHDTTSPLLPKTEDFNVKTYHDDMREYTEICRARACIKTEDNDNFTPVASRMRYLEKQLDMHHKFLFKVAETLNDENIVEAVRQLKRGVALMGEMAELRLPRNRNANGIYDKDNPAFNNRDASTVGRLKERIEAIAQQLTLRPPFALSGSGHSR
jgi:hypothetical protein